MDPVRETSEEKVGDKRSTHSKYHDVGKVLEESLASHVVSRGEHDRRDAEVEKNIVVENDVFLDGVVVTLEGSQTYYESNSRDVAGFVAERSIGSTLECPNYQEAYDEEEHQQGTKLNNKWRSFTGDRSNRCWIAHIVRRFQAKISLL